jgi:GNAT superfamily N-acetyltransferase
MPHVWVAAPDEADDVARLLAAFRTWYGKSEPSDEAFLAGVRRLIGTDHTEYLLAAVGDGPPVGVAQVRYRHSVWASADDCWLEDLFVAEEARGGGLGRAIVETVLVRARERGCRRVELDVDDANTSARALYEKLGFAEKNGGAAYMQRHL